MKDRIENEIRALKEVERINKILTDFSRIDGWGDLRTYLSIT